MRKLVVQKVEQYDYSLVDENGVVYQLNIEFYTKYKPKINDIVYVDEKLLEEVNLYAFGELEKTGNIEEKDIIKVVNKENEYYFQRVYG